VKAGMNSLCRTIAAEEKENEIGIWAIRPGMVDVGLVVLLLCVRLIFRSDFSED